MACGSFTEFNLFNAKVEWQKRRNGETRSELQTKLAQRFPVGQKSKDRRKRLLYQRKLRSFTLTPHDKELQQTFACVDATQLNILQESFSSEYILEQWRLYQKQRLQSQPNDDDLKKYFVKCNVKYLTRVRKKKNLQQLASRQLVKSLGGLWLETKGLSYVGSMAIKIVCQELNEMQQFKSVGILV